MIREGDILDPFKVYCVFSSIFQCLYWNFPILTESGETGSDNFSLEIQRNPDCCESEYSLDWAGCLFWVLFDI